MVLLVNAAPPRRVKELVWVTTARDFRCGVCDSFEVAPALFAPRLFKNGARCGLRGRAGARAGYGLKGYLTTRSTPARTVDVRV